MSGWKILLHSVRMVFGNFRQVLQVAIGPSAIGAVILVALFYTLDIPQDVLYASTADPLAEKNQELTETQAANFFMFVVPVIWLIGFWIAVSWHRFILLEEYPRGVFPTFYFNRILAYFGRTVQLGLLLAAMMFVLLFPGILLAISIDSPPVMLFWVLAAMIIFLSIAVRLAIVLPATAIGNPITLRDAWTRTKGATGAILVLLLVGAFFQFLLQMGVLLLAAIPVLGIFLSLFVGSLIFPMINVSILTTMYGVFVERRDLN